MCSGADVLNFGTENAVSDCDLFFLPYSILDKCGESASQDTIQYAI